MKITPSLSDLIKEKSKYDIVPISSEILSDFTTPIEVLKALRNISKNCFLLESVEGGEKWGRYSFLGLEPKMEIRLLNGEMTIIDGAKVIIKKSDNPNLEIREVLSKFKSPIFPYLPPFTGGLVGYFAYEFYKYNEKITLDNVAKDISNDMHLMLFDKVIAFDNLRQKIVFIVNIKTDNIEENYIAAQKEIENLISIVKNFQGKDDEKCSVSPFTSEFSKEEYIGAVNKAKHYIKEGDIFQVVPSNCMSATMQGSLFSAYRVLRTTNPSPYMYYLSSDEIEIAGASPETLIKKIGNKLFTFPIAGTKPRGNTGEEDKFFQNELLSSEKERAEHNMLVDLARNDLGKVSKIGSVKVSDYMKIHLYSKVMHLTSSVTSEIENGKDCLDALSSALPAGTLSGAPKKRACEIINELEKSRRGIYGGSIGYINFTGDMDMCIAIRTAVKSGNKVTVRSGGGVVYDSNPVEEYLETVNKAKAVIEAVIKSANMEE